MSWQVGAKVMCHGVNWGECRVALNNQNVIMIHCGHHDLVVCGNQQQLEDAGWALVPQNNIVRLTHRRRDHSSSDPFLS